MNKINCLFGFLLFCGAFFWGCKESASTSTDNEDTNEIISDNAEDVRDNVMSVRKYVEWLQDPKNGVRKEKNMGDLNFILQYKPYEYIVCMEEREQKIYDSVLKSRRNELKGIQYYDLKIILNGKDGELLKYNLSSNDQYEKRVNYFAFEIQNDIELVDGNDTLPCVLCHFERTYDVAPYCTVLVGFKANQNNIQKQKTFLFHDRTFNKGLLKFTFKENRLTNLPKLQTI